MFCPAPRTRDDGRVSDEQATIRVTVSDPWDFTSAAGSNVFEAKIVDHDADGAVLLHFATPVERDGRSWDWFFADRASGDCRLYGVPEEAREEWANAGANWRGQTPAARATLGVDAP